MITDPQRRLLAILAADTSGLTPRRIAKQMWPDSPAWNRRTHRRGAGGGGAGTPGGTMPMKAGTMLRRLESDRLVSQYDPHRNRLDEYRWWITPQGRAALATTKPRGSTR